MPPIPDKLDVVVTLLWLFVLGLDIEVLDLDPFRLLKPQLVFRSGSGWSVSNGGGDGNPRGAKKLLLELLLERGLFPEIFVDTGALSAYVALELNSNELVELLLLLRSKRWWKYGVVLDELLLVLVDGAFFILCCN